MTPSFSNPRQDHAERDADLIRRIRGNDDAALDALVVAYAAWLTNVAVPIVASPDLAQDVVQDVFVRLWDIRHSLQIGGSVAGYLYRAVRNRAHNLNAHEQAQHRLAAQAYPSGEEPRVMNAGEAALEGTDFTRALDAALSTLQPRTRDIFLMRAQADMSYAEIAHELGIGIPTVRMQMYRATTALARRLAPWLDPESAFDLGGEGAP